MHRTNTPPAPLTTTAPLSPSGGGALRAQDLCVLLLPPDGVLDPSVAAVITGQLLAALHRRDVDTVVAHDAHDAIARAAMATAAIELAHRSLNEPRLRRFGPTVPRGVVLLLVDPHRHPSSVEVVRVARQYASRAVCWKYMSSPVLALKPNLPAGWAANGSLPANMPQAGAQQTGASPNSQANQEQRPDLSPITDDDLIGWVGHQLGLVPKAGNRQGLPMNVTVNSSGASIRSNPLAMIQESATSCPSLHGSRIMTRGTPISGANGVVVPLGTSRMHDSGWGSWLSSTTQIADNTVSNEASAIISAPFGKKSIVSALEIAMLLAKPQLGVHTAGAAVLAAKQEPSGGRVPPERTRGGLES